MSPASTQPAPALAAATIAWRELVRFFRQPNRVVGAIGQPVIFWLLFGTGLRQSFQLPGVSGAQSDYRIYFFPGALVLILLFTAIFATISIIEDRREGFLQSVLVAPIPRWSMVLGKVLGGAAIALLQGLLFLALALTLDVRPGVLAIVGIVLLAAILAVALTALGFWIAWRMDSTQGFHAIMSVFLLPMWLLSGAFFPVPRTDRGGILETALHWLMRANPLTYGVAGMRRLLAGTGGLLPAETPPLAVCWIVSILFAAATLTLAWRVAGRRTAGDLL